MRPSKPVRYEEISIHAPLAGRDRLSLGLDSELVEISIHAPLAGRDRSKPLEVVAFRIFQSTRPLRGATANVHKKYVHVCENRQKKLFSLPNAVCQSA